DTAAEGHIDEAVAEGKCTALLLDVPVEAGRGGRDDRRELHHAGRQVQALEPVDVIGAVEGDHVDAAAGDVDNGCAEDALGPDVAAAPTCGLGRAKVPGPNGRACGLVDRVDAVVHRGRVDDAVVDQRLGEDVAVERGRHPARGGARHRGQGAVETGVAVVAVVDGPRPVGYGCGLRWVDGGCGLGRNDRGGGGGHRRSHAQRHA